MKGVCLKESRNLEFISSFGQQVEIVPFAFFSRTGASSELNASCTITLNKIIS